jgi:hypothetical protein
MLWVVDDHHPELNIADSKEMMVARAYGMSFELNQFSLFHVSLHIDATSDTSKECCPFVTVTSMGGEYPAHQSQLKETKVKNKLLLNQVVLTELRLLL